jgi:hypothetical protein
MASRQGFISPRGSRQAGLSFNKSFKTLLGKYLDEIKQALLTSKRTKEVNTK